MLAYVEKGQIVVFNGFSGRPPSYTLTINRRNIAEDPEVSRPDDSLHYVNVRVRVSEKLMGNKVRPAGIKMLNMQLSSYAEVQTVLDIFKNRME